ncbi:sulfite exporter TauE/SafE family protein [Sulfuricystis multivorans]|uniref:sulfite exporter TauE/SafE family protein n=1 Tax=Sulfuricystis multivorans TaxID=2211108 RepID=UPI000F81E72A|nr:sulfite exporter TauE/SafE family protein [Sulfuricystis multivorans]
MELAQIISGFAVGTLVGITGVGGGALMTPLLVLLFGVAPITAVGTDLLYAALTKTGGAIIHARYGHIEWRIVGRLALGSLPAAVLALLFVHHFVPGGLGNAHQTIRFFLGLALLFTAAAMILRLRLLARGKGGNRVTRDRAWPTVLAGTVLGILVALSSVGAGALGVTALFFLYPGLSPIRIVGADIAHAVPLTLVAGLGHWWWGNIDWSLLSALLVGSLPGVWLGSHLAPRIPEVFLRAALAVLLVFAGGKLITN